MTPAERLAEFDRLDLDLYLEQRVLYRRLVAVGGQRGVRPPVKPKYLSRRPLQSLEPRPKTASRVAPLLVRSFELQLESDNGRTIETRIVPYNVPTEVADAPDFRPYMETWLPGAFEKQLRASGRPKVWLIFEHEQGLRGIVGHALALRDEDDGLHGSFSVHDNSDGEKALQMIRENILTGLSLEATPLRTVKRGTIVERVQARLNKVSLCRSPAFATAQVLAIRER